MNLASLSVPKAVNLNWKKYTVINQNLMRPTDPSEVRGISSKASKYLLWKPEISGGELVVRLVKAQIDFGKKHPCRCKAI